MSEITLAFLVNPLIQTEESPRIADVELNSIRRYGLN